MVRCIVERTQEHYTCLQERFCSYSLRNHHCMSISHNPCFRGCRTPDSSRLEPALVSESVWKTVCYDDMTATPVGTIRRVPYLSLQCRFTSFFGLSLRLRPRILTEANEVPAVEVICRHYHSSLGYGEKVIGHMGSAIGM